KEEDASTVTGMLIKTSLRGVDSHGCFWMPYYIEGVKNGQIKVNPNVKIIKDSTVITLIDGDNGFGPVIAMQATKKTIEKAKKSGIAIATIKNLSHIGTMAYYAEEIVKNRMIAFVTTNSPSDVAPYGGVEKLLGTDPICYGFPVDENLSIILDMATSVVAAGRIAVYASKGQMLPEKWVVDKYGNPSTDPRSFFDNGSLLPLGGLLFSGYKGYGLGLSVELLAGVLTGSKTAPNLPKGWHIQGGVIIEALDIESFRPYDEYKEAVMDLINRIKSAKLMKGFNEILLPGEPETREMSRRKKEGIPITEDVWGKMMKVAQDLGVEPPKTAHIVP
ncbi:MAG: Ldh family oxidoreductase, partial [Thermoplasmata archaeon]